MILEQIDTDLKQAMLAGDKTQVTTLRGLKSALQYASVEAGQADLSDPEVIKVLRKEAKKRQEAIELYEKGGDRTRSQSESDELKIIEKYLPAQISDDEINKVIDEVTTQIELSQQTMGQVIGQVKAKTAGAADGSAIARLVQGRLNN